MPERFIKKFIYSILTFVVIFFIGFLIFKIVEPNPSCFDRKLNNGESGIDCGGPCQSCEIQKLTMLEYGSNAAGFLQNNNYFIYTKVTNINDNWGAKEFEYVFYFVKNVEEKGKTKEKVVKQIENTSYILPNQVKYIVEMVEKPNFQFDKVIFKINEKKIS